MKALKKITAAITLLATLSGCTSINGVVRDKPTGNPISSATITIKGSSGVTNAMGAYQVVGPFLPQDTLMVNAPGYNIYTESLGDSKIHDIELVPR